MKTKIYTIKCVVWEYYQVRAESKANALNKPIEDPFFIEHRTKQITKDPLEETHK